MNIYAVCRKNAENAEKAPPALFKAFN